MNLRDLECLLMISEEKNITRAAEKLYVTPSALTQLINRTERELGTPLFIRSRNGCMPTEAGELYIESARKILQIRSETYNRIYDTANCRNTTLTIGFPPEHGAGMFTTVYPVFREMYPDIHIQIRESSVRRQQQMIANGEIDLGFMTLLDSQKTQDEYVPLMQEELLIALPSNAPQTTHAVQQPGSRFPVLDIRQLQDYPIAQLYPESTFYGWTQGIFAAAGFEPKAIVETTRHSTILRMVSAWLCGGLVTDYHCNHEFAHANVSFFCLPDHPVWQVMACYRKDSYLSRPMRSMIELAKEYWHTKALN